MMINLKRLEFTLPEPEKLFEKEISNLKNLSNELNIWANKAGTNNQRFNRALDEVQEAIRFKRPLEETLRSKTHVRAFALSLESDTDNQIKVTQKLLDTITQIVIKPTSLLIESFYQHFLKKFDELGDTVATGAWLLKSMKHRGIVLKHGNEILSANGPQWLANQAIQQNIDFDQLVHALKLDRYSRGKFITLAQSIYYVERLKTITLNQDHELLHEVQKPNVYESSYDRSLLGLKILEILISRAQGTAINDSWLNVIMAIAGDPRIPKDHPRYIKWWTHINDTLIKTVRGWLSRYDLKLFLESLEDFSHTSGNSKLIRMYPQRKQFLEGLFDAGLIKGTRLYMSRAATRYIKKYRDEKHLPDFSMVKDGDKSVIFVEFDYGYMIEGSHDCSLRFYKHLEPSICVFNYLIKSPTFSQLTTDIYTRMSGIPGAVKPPITHNTSNFSWQRKALTTLKELGISVKAKDVLSDSDYKEFKQLFGVREWQ
ncbi:EH signature domain-containing protein [Vibrio sp. MEBiC08052]|uniref:EH signature domain-containing protein n=1 Tax=Vibrio sp. MEBiC08052 TaxID=1761910 RepID=UPI00074058A7|nr:EH signature domain-containing protein [Vibrio sp. MEBiC08052]KUI99564.1 hypothetical protein VRK_12990 [Vibrio sp. MEBiC08052]